MINPNEVSALIEATTNINWLHHTYRQCANRLAALGKMVVVTELYNPDLPSEQILRGMDRREAPVSAVPNIGFDPDFGEAEFTKLPNVETLPTASAKRTPQPIPASQEKIDDKRRYSVMIDGKRYSVQPIQLDGKTTGFQINEYQIRRSDGKVTCTCPDYVHRSYNRPQGCKHMQAIQSLTAEIIEPKPDPNPVLEPPEVAHEATATNPPMLPTLEAQPPTDIGSSDIPQPFPDSEIVDKE